MNKDKVYIAFLTIIVVLVIFSVNYTLYDLFDIDLESALIWILMSIVLVMGILAKGEKIIQSFKSRKAKR